MLSLNLAKIRTAHERIERTYTPQALEADHPNLGVVAPVTLAFDLEKDQSRFRLVGRVQTVLELVCSRCLEPFPFPVDTAFDLRYQPKDENVGEGEREIGEDDLSSAFYENEAIDLGQLMGEQFYLSLPMKPLCADSCRGLCSQCGANLNGGDCGCARAWEDSRFAELKALKSTVSSPYNTNPSRES